MGRVANVLPLTLVLLSASAQIGNPQHVHLVDDSPLVAQAMVAPVPLIAVPEAQVSRQQLQVDLAALKKMRPGLGAPITFIIIGGATAIISVLLFTGFSALGSGLGTTPQTVGAVGASISLPLGALGSWLLYNRLEERGRLDQEARRLRLQLDAQTGTSRR